MDKVKDMAFMAAGALMVLGYQKYNKPVRNSLNRMINKEKKVAKDALESMM